LDVQFGAMVLMFWSMGIMHWDMWWIVAIALVVCVGATNVINFMDGINGITAGYSLAVLIPLIVLNHNLHFVDSYFLIVAALGVLVFSVFNFRPKGKAKCFAGDVGSISIAFIMLFAIGKLVMATGDVTWLLFLLVYGVDGCLTICHRILLHENLGEAHRKHAYQLMANELKMSHVKVSLIYMALQLVVSLGFIYVCPNTVLAHWIYLVGALVVLAVVYVLFKKKYYHLHEEYLAGLKG
jgi:UDP-N-acetylmuramyl pentapeptide phosphotransferase/UDP-N-acetylglucosamine-1-phosphate transferase